MNIEAAEVELYLRKYQWALTDLTREIEKGCPFLKTLSDPSVLRFLTYTEQFSTTERLELAKLSKKNGCRPAMQLLGETLIQEDEVRIKSYQAELRSIPLPSVLSSPITKTFALKRADVAKTVLSFLSSAFNSKPEKFESLSWFYTAFIGDWRFHTSLDFSGTWGTEIRCYHRLVRSDSKNWGFLLMPLPSAIGPIEVPQFFSLLSLYGLSPGIYYIDSIDDVQVAAQAILNTYNRLYQAASIWVDHLTFN